MSLTKINITVESAVLNEDDPIPEKTAESAVGTMRWGKGGVESICYKTKADGTEVETRLELYGEDVRLIRSGAVESNMLFSKGKEHKSLYRIPPYAFELSLEATRVKNSLTFFGGSLELEYKMTLGGAKKTCKMHVCVAPV